MSDINFEKCYNKAHYLKEYKNIHGKDIKRVAKPVIDGEETNFFECKKCQSIYNYENNPVSEFEKGCPNCQSKDFEMKISLWNGILHYKIKECSKCHKMDMADLIKWPESDNIKGKSKAEIIKIMRQENITDNCQCSHQEDDDNRERERERESKNGFNWSSPWVIGGGIAIVGIIGIIIYFLTRRNKTSKEY